MVHFVSFSNQNIYYSITILNTRELPKEEKLIDDVVSSQQFNQTGDAVNERIEKLEPAMKGFVSLFPSTHTTHKGKRRVKDSSFIYCDRSLITSLISLAVFNSDPAIPHKHHSRFFHQSFDKTPNTLRLLDFLSHHIRQHITWDS